VRLYGVAFHLFPEEEGVEWRFRAEEMVEEEGVRGDAYAVMTDMIGDTLHMAMRLGLSLDEALTIAGRAILNFQNEVEEEALRQQEATDSTGA